MPPRWRTRVVLEPARPLATGSEIWALPPLAGLIGATRTPCARRASAAGPISVSLVAPEAARECAGSAAAATARAVAAIPPNRVREGSDQPMPTVTVTGSSACPALYCGSNGGAAAAVRVAGRLAQVTVLPPFE